MDGEGKTGRTWRFCNLDNLSANQLGCGESILTKSGLGMAGTCRAAPRFRRYDNGKQSLLLPSGVGQYFTGLPTMNVSFLCGRS